MPMRVARIDREKTLKTLAGNLFVIEGPNRPANLERAMAALLRANPGLARRESFKRGAAVAVPVDTGLPLSDRVARPAAGPDVLSRETVERLELGARIVRERAEAANEADEAALDRLRDARFVRALKKAAPGGAELVPEATRSIQQRIAANKEAQATLEKAIEESTAAIERLQRLAQGQGD